MEYNNHYNANTGEQTRTPRRTQGPPTQENSANPAFEPPVAAPPLRSAAPVTPGSYGDLMLLAVLLLLWLEKRDEDALLTLLALILIG